MTLAESIEEYGADAMRIAMADAGDGLEDANFVQKIANAEVLRLASELEWMDLVLAQHEEQVIVLLLNGCQVVDRQCIGSDHQNPISSGQQNIKSLHVCT